MTFHIPGVGLIFRAVGGGYGWARRRTFGRTLEASHREWEKRTGLGSHWFGLGEGIECSARLARLIEGPSQSHIALRSTSKQINALTVVVEAQSGGMVFDETRTVSDVGSTIRVISLPGIPQYHTFVAADRGGIKTTYEEFRVRITSITENGVPRPTNLRSPSFHPIDNVLAEPDNWINWQGKAINVGALRERQDALKTRWWRKLGHPTVGMGRAFSGVSYPRYLLAVAVLSDPVVRTAYWVRLALGREKFSDHGKIRAISD